MGANNTFGETNFNPDNKLAVEEVQDALISVFIQGSDIKHGTKKLTLSELTELVRGKERTLEDSLNRSIEILKDFSKSGEAIPMNIANAILDIEKEAELVRGKERTLAERYEEETGKHWKMSCSTGQPTVDYTRWLEEQLLKNRE